MNDPEGPKSIARSYACAKRRLKWLLPLVSMFPALANACIIQTPAAVLSVPLPPSISGTADNNPPGILFPGTSYASEYAISFDFRDCTAQAVNRITVEPAGKMVSGVTYAEGGQTYPVYETGIPGIGYALGASFGYQGPWTAISAGPTEFFSGSMLSGVVFQRINLVVTGRLVSGNYSKGNQLLSTVVLYRASGSTTSTKTTLNISGSVAVKTRGCKVTSGETNAVVLPAVVTHSLKAVGSVSNVSLR